MKKQKLKLNYHKLHIAEPQTVRFLISQQIFFFFLGAIGGFVWEVILYLIQDGTFIKRGFFHGPWLPIYGVGAVFFYMLLDHPIWRARELLHPPEKSVRPTTTMRPAKLIRLFFLSLLIGTGIEFVVGWFLDTFWGLRYWTYEGVPFNFRGYICLSSSICFGIAGAVWVGFLAGRLTRFWIRIPVKIREEINTILVLLFLLDCAAALILPNMGNGITFQ